MGWGERKYDDAQRAAVIYHKNVRKLSGKVISDLAHRGELEAVSGQMLPAFEIPKDSVYSLARDDIARSRRMEVSALVTALPADANEAIRRRLVEMLDRRTNKLVDAARRGKDIAPEEITKLARAAREVAALPGYGLRAPQPGRQAAGAPGGEKPATSDSAAGAIFAAAKGGAIKAAPTDLQVKPDVGGGTRGTTENTSVGGASPTAEDTAEDTQDGQAEGAGSRASAEIQAGLALAQTGA